MLNNIYLFYLSSMLFFILSNFFFIMSLNFMYMKLNLFIEWYLFKINSIMFNLYIYMDWMSLMFMFLIFLISSMIMWYSNEYMNHDNNKLRFFWILFFFIISMILMILSPNILSILLGWDGLGLTSYCLIIFYQNKFSYNSGMLTFFMNRIGDIMMILSLFLMMNLGSFNLMNYNNLNNKYIMMFLILASFTKSAQFPFSSWLPAAMAAPTPVSSLVHSSTLVTAGIYLMIRFIDIMNSNYLNYMFYTGLITMLMAGINGNLDYDLKKIIAYSTLSQLGLMMMILSFKLNKIVFFHLIIHAMFKSMMFMCSGIMIHNLCDYQDIRYMGNIKNYMPLTSIILMISNFSLCGLPFYSGFYSKDLLLETMILNFKINMFMYIMIMISTMLTVLYSFRLFYYLMMSNFKFNSYNLIMNNVKMNFSLIILYAGTW